MDQAMIKSIVMVALAGVALIFCIAGLATEWASVKYEGSGWESTTKIYYLRRTTCTKGGGTEQCTTVKVGDFECSSQASTGEAAVAFGILGCLAITAGLAVTVLIRFVKLPPLQPLAIPLVAGTFGSAALFLLIAWACTFGLWDSVKCNDRVVKDIDNAKAGPAGPLLFMTWLFDIGAAVVFFVLKDGGSAVAPAAPVATNEAK